MQEKTAKSNKMFGVVSAISHDDLGELLELLGKYKEAEQHRRKSLLITEESSLLGTIPKMGSLKSLGQNLLMQHRYSEAADYLARANQLFGDYARDMITGASEAEALNLLIDYESIYLGPLVSAWRKTERPIDDLYHHVWAIRRILQRTIANRQQALMTDN